MAAEEEKQEGKGFTVQDRRRFSPETGEAREGAPQAEAAADRQAQATTTENRNEAE